MKETIEAGMLLLFVLILYVFASIGDAAGF